MTDEERHGVRDSLLDWAVFSLLDNEQSAIPTLLSPFDNHDACTYAQGKYSRRSLWPGDGPHQWLLQARQISMRNNA